MKVIGVDVGGTFTDLIYCDLDTGSMSINKVPTTPEDPSKGVMNGVEGLLASIGQSAGAIDFIFHATTTATNAVLEDKGANAGMITNEGFRDILHIGRHQRVRALFHPSGIALAESPAHQAAQSHGGRRSARAAARR